MISWIETHPFAALVPVVVVFVAVIVPIILAARRINRARKRNAHKPPLHPDA